MLYHRIGSLERKKVVDFDQSLKVLLSQFTHSAGCE